MPEIPDEIARESNVEFVTRLMESSSASVRHADTHAGRRSISFSSTPPR